MVVVSSATERVTWCFSFTAIEAVRVKGVVEPITVYRVDDDTGVRTRIALSHDRRPHLTRRSRARTRGDAERWGPSRYRDKVRQPSSPASRASESLALFTSSEIALAPRELGSSSKRRRRTTSALHPVVEELKRALEIDRAAVEGDGVARLTQELDSRGISAPGTRHALAWLFSLDEQAHTALELAPQEQKRRAFGAIRALMAAKSNRPRSQRFRGHSLGRSIDPRTSQPPTRPTLRVNGSSS